MLRLRSVVTLAGLILATWQLTGCTSLAPSSLSQRQALTTPQVAKLKDWDLNGRFGYRDNADHSGFTAAISWQQQVAQKHIDIVGPLGLWRASLSDGNGHALLALSDGRQFQADSLSALMQTNLAWYLPVDGLKYWLFALPQPGSPATVGRDAKGQVVNIEQAGWQISYPEYQSIDGYRVPKRLLLVKGPLQLSLVIQRWQIHL